MEKCPHLFLNGSICICESLFFCIRNKICYFCIMRSCMTGLNERNVCKKMKSTMNMENFLQKRQIRSIMHKSTEWTVPRNVDSGIDEIMQENYGSPDLWTVKMQHFVLDQQHLLRGPRSVDIYDPHHQDEQNVVNRSTRRTPPLPAGSK